MWFTTAKPEKAASAVAEGGRVSCESLWPFRDMYSVVA